MHQYQLIDHFKQSNTTILALFCLWDEAQDFEREFLWDWFSIKAVLYQEDKFVPNFWKLAMPIQDSIRYLNTRWTRCRAVPHPFSCCKNLVIIRDIVFDICWCDVNCNQITGGRGPLDRG